MAQPTNERQDLLMKSSFNEATTFIKKKNISIECMCPSKPQYVLADKKALERILTNLIDNAFDILIYFYYSI
mgnify:CR=1 FL=1